MTVTTPRRGMSSMRRLKVFEAAGGICHICGQKIRGAWEVEHVRPLALGGADGGDNLAPAHKDCHATKTKADNASWTKAKRIKAKAVGAWRAAHPMPGSKRSKWRKLMNGEVVLR